ncbi:Ctf8-domain-containing protein [Sparassis latifolia]
MIIPINLDTVPLSPLGSKFPPQLAQFGTDEVVLIELQGALDVEGDRQGETVGTLRIDDVTKTTLLIGHHLLEGKLVNLPKPIAVLQHVSSSSNDHDQPIDDNVDMVSEGEAKSTLVEWNVVAVVKTKMVFSRRPMPMVGKDATALLDPKRGKKAK